MDATLRENVEALAGMRKRYNELQIHDQLRTARDARNKAASDLKLAKDALEEAESGARYDIVSSSEFAGLKNDTQRKAYIDKEMTASPEVKAARSKVRAAEGDLAAREAELQHLKDRCASANFNLSSALGVVRAYETTKELQHA